MLEMFRIRDPPVALDDVFLVAVERGFLEQVSNRIRAGLENFHSLPVNLLLAEFEGAAGADQLLADLCAYGQGFVFLGAEGVKGAKGVKGVEMG